MENETESSTEDTRIITTAKEDLKKTPSKHSIHSGGKRLYWEPHTIREGPQSAT